MVVSRRGVLQSTAGLVGGLVLGGWASSAAAAAGIPAAAARKARRPLAERLQVCRPAGDPLDELLRRNLSFSEVWQQAQASGDPQERARLLQQNWPLGCQVRPEALAEGQKPWAAILCCADSRVASEWLFASGSGELFEVRCAGNTAFNAGVASLEYAVAALAVSQFVDAAYRTRALAMVISASSLGGAVAPLLMAPVMEQLGWRAVFVISATMGAATAAACLLFMPRATPAHAASRQQPTSGFFHGARVLLGEPNLQRLSIAYLLHSAVYFVFVFWFFRYLTEGRGFTILSSGVWASLPNVAGFVAAPLIGTFVDSLGARIGGATARRRVAMACLLGAAAFALTGAVVPGAALAIVALSLSSACLNGAESPFFTSATTIGAPHAGAAAGLLNLMGNLGGVLSIWLAPQMSAAWGWNATLLCWAAVAFVAAILWLTVRVNDHATTTRDR